MTTRRKFLTTAMLASAAATAGSTAAEKKSAEGKHYRTPVKIGMGGVALGNGFAVTPDAQADETMAAAWEAGVRFFDTSPWYGLGLSERRFGHFLDGQKRDEFVLSTKIGRLMTPDENFRHGMWKGHLGFNYKYDYTAAGTRRSIEDSLQRMGLSSIDIVFIHDLSPDNGDMKEKWTEYFDIAAKGAMPELTKMRDEGIIKAWGFGVNRPQPILKALEVSDPDIFLAATQYSLMKHEDALENLFPACNDHGVSLVIGAPLNAGFLAGLDRYDYGGKIPEGFKEKREKMMKVAKNYDTDLRTAALQFTAAPSVVSATIPGARTPKQVEENMASMKAKIPPEFWEVLKKEKLISANAPVPG
ncbi:MAG: aldo/keto reductase [Akkermansiaceae bacterium]|nr:aldo/keto reductase [Akkermansiaceae bacterium]